MYEVVVEQSEKLVEVVEEVCLVLELNVIVFVIVIVNWKEMQFVRYPGNE